VRVAEVTITFDEAVIAGLAKNTDVAAVMDMLAGRVLSAQKARCPVSPVQPVYASGGATVAGGTRYAGDFPLRPSGYLRSSCRALREPDGSVIIGPTAPYGIWVNNGTPPHVIESHGPWPLRNRATGQVFGPIVHHPGTRPQPFITDSLSAIAGAIVEA
jgi:hypothetical protein